MTTSESGAGRPAIVTSVTADQSALRGRTYAIPFETVWQAALQLCRTRLRGWSVRSADDADGIIEAEVHPRMVGGAANITIIITLDADAQTRVDARAVPHTDWDFGANRRRLRRFFAKLDALLVRRPSGRTRRR